MTCESGSKVAWEEREEREGGKGGKRALTPVQRFRQADASWFRSGQTTTLFSSDTEKDPVSEARGGIPSCIYPRAGDRAQWAKGRGRVAKVKGRAVGVNGRRGALVQLVRSFGSSDGGGVTEGSGTKQALTAVGCWAVVLRADNEGRGTGSRESGGASPASTQQAQQELQRRELL